MIEPPLFKPGKLVCRKYVFLSNEENNVGTRKIKSTSKSTNDGMIYVGPWNKLDGRSQKGEIEIKIRLLLNRFIMCKVYRIHTHNTRGT